MCLGILILLLLPLSCAVPYAHRQPAVNRQAADGPVTAATSAAEEGADEDNDDGISFEILPTDWQPSTHADTLSHHQQRLLAAAESALGSVNQVLDPGTLASLTHSTDPVVGGLNGHSCSNGGSTASSMHDAAAGQSTNNNQAVDNVQPASGEICRGLK